MPLLRVKCKRHNFNIVVIILEISFWEKKIGFLKEIYLKTEGVDKIFFLLFKPENCKKFQNYFVVKGILCKWLFLGVNEENVKNVVYYKKIAIVTNGQCFYHI